MSFLQCYSRPEYGLCRILARNRKPCMKSSNIFWSVCICYFPTNIERCEIPSTCKLVIKGYSCIITDSIDVLTQDHCLLSTEKIIISLNFWWYHRSILTNKLHVLYVFLSRLPEKNILYHLFMNCQKSISPSNSLNTEAKRTYATSFMSLSTARTSAPICVDSISL